MNVDLFVDAGVLFGIFFCLQILFGQLALRKKNIKNYLLAMSALLVGIYQFSISFQLFSDYCDWYSVFPYVNTLGMVSIYFAIPALYLFFTALPENGFSMTWKLVLHFIIPSVVAILLIIFAKYPHDPGGIARDYKEFLHYNDQMLNFTDNLSVVLVECYFVLMIMRYIAEFRRSQPERRRNISAVIMFFIIAIVIFLMYVSYYSQKDFFHNIFKLRFTILAGYLIFVSYRYPFVSNIINLEAHRESYIKSQIKKLQPGDVVESLEKLMSTEKLYLKPDLTVRETAGRLGVTPHQLSEILNTRLNKSFNTYVKFKRIEYARKLLVEKPEMTILVISLESGFNSISNFNTTFKYIAGKSPKEYRKANLLK